MPKNRALTQKSMDSDMTDLISSGQRTVQMESDAVGQLHSRIDKNFAAACEKILACKGRVVVTGMGKSGHIGSKIAATLASTGTPAFFVHPGEASHGDLGMITKADVVIAISNSGSTSEILTLIPLIVRLNIPLISMTGDAESELAKTAGVNLDVSVEAEACPLNLAPTTSTTVTLVMGDALAIALLEARQFSAEDFAFSHPGGALGRRLLLRVKDIMHQGAEMPTIMAHQTLRDALVEMTQKGFGMTSVMSSDQRLIGVFTDGDLRRIFDLDIDINTTTIDKVMTSDPKTIDQNMLAAEALTLMEDRAITALIVKDSESYPVGIVHLHDILRAGVV
ncbi:KpsF/GutQ family sugar-phosphate isomerase [Porticoccaceae bacterium]|nr:KpsF/GutQ family sugar-phosphate isomerase [Porticoccaceae bacterium]MDB2634554.1 KpsF/GutQ family sugar-phosphate isomerase [Porticoccaceae bacterium]MDB2664027.1 KpsF/GutQ family sugar-phosphate isomerase [Porticoccaceae bacterium]